MLDTHLADIVEMAYAVRTGKPSAGLALLGCLDVLVGDKVVKHDRDLVLVKHGIKSGLFELVDRDRRRDIVAEYNVQLCADQLTGSYLVKPCMGGKDLLSHGHSHRYFPSLVML